MESRHPSDDVYDSMMQDNWNEHNEDVSSSLSSPTGKAAQISLTTAARPQPCWPPEPVEHRDCEDFITGASNTASSSTSSTTSASGPRIMRKHSGGRDQKPKLPPRRCSTDEPEVITASSDVNRPASPSRGDAPPTCPGRTRSSDKWQPGSSIPRRGRRYLSSTTLEEASRRPISRTRPSSQDLTQPPLTDQAFQTLIQQSSLIRDRKYHMRTYRQVFVGRECIDLLLAKGVCATRQEAVHLGNHWLQQGLFHHVVYDHCFQDRFLFYRFTSTTELVKASRKRRFSSGSSSSSGKHSETKTLPQEPVLPLTRSLSSVSMMAINFSIDEEEPLLSEDGAKTIDFPWSRKGCTSARKRSSRPATNGSNSRSGSKNSGNRRMF